MEVNKVITGDCIEEMKKLSKNSVDSVVTDPPYGLAFMGKSWDDFSPKEFQEFSQKWGEQALRLLKPGGYLLAFCGTRTYHRLVVGLEDAGFTIKDQIDWLYGQGFPKSHDISKAIDKHFDKEDERENTGELMKGHSEGRNRTYGKNGNIYGDIEETTAYVTKPATSEAEEWEGWGTALKPAHEPIVVAQKPRDGTYAENCLKWGTGGINIDESRVEHNEPIKKKKAQSGGNKVYRQSGRYEDTTELKPSGRWPANIIHDNSEEVRECFPETKSGKAVVGTGKGYAENASGIASTGKITSCFADSGNASRFFYSAKAQKSERNAGLEDLEPEKRSSKDKMMGDSKSFKTGSGNERTTELKNNIATLKPINLMRWLCRLVTPEDGVVLDPFGGSGTTGCAAVIEGFDYLLIEKRERFAKTIAPKRIEYWSKESNWDELKSHNELPDPVEERNSKLTDYTDEVGGSS